MENNLEKTDMPNDAGLTEIDEQEFSKLTQHINEVKLSPIFEAEEPAKEDTSQQKENEETKTKQANKETDVSGTPLGELVSASFVLNLTNILIPVLIVMGFKKAGYETKKQEYQLTAAETKVLDEPLQKYLNYIRINLNNPLYNLMLALSIVYGSKIVEGAQKAEKIKKKTVVKEPLSNEPSISVEEYVDQLAENQDWMEGFTPEQIDLIKATRKRRNKSYSDAIEWLRKKNQL